MPTQTRRSVAEATQDLLAHLDPGNFDEEHGAAQDMAGVVGPELDALVVDGLVEIDRRNPVHAGQHVVLSE